ncbi:MAG TPA: LamG domain-containing protein, partial [Polyangium sp.]|nr:LamG domain-containing protein [Polyangium sp.]
MAIKDKWIDFNGTDGYVNAGRGIEAYTITQAITLEAWILPDTYVANRVMGVISKLQTSTSPSSGYGLLVVDGKLRLEFYDTAGTLRQLQSQTAMSANAWHHVAATFDGATIRLYVDGAEVISSNVGSATIGHSSEAELWIGRGPGGYFKGNMCEARIWSVARTATQILNDQLASPDASVAGLNARWPLDDGSTLYANDSRNGLKATLLGSAIPGSTLTTTTVDPQPTMQAPTALINTSSVLNAALDKLNRKSVMELLKQL